MAEMFEINPDRPMGELIDLLKTGLMESHRRGSLSFAMAPLTAMLVKLSRDAERTATKVVRLTWALVALTVALLVLTAYLAWHEANQQGAQHTDLNAKGSAQQTQPQPAPVPDKK